MQLRLCTSMGFDFQAPGILGWYRQKLLRPSMASLKSTIMEANGENDDDDDEGWRYSFFDANTLWNSGLGMACILFGIWRAMHIR